MIIDPKSYSVVDFLSDNRARYPLWIASCNDVNDSQYVVPAHKHDVALINTKSSVQCLSNICTHKHATILQGRGDIKSSITCPIHKWTWDTNGRLRGARGFERDASMNLDHYMTHQWQGHIFINDSKWMHDISKLGLLANYLDIRNYTWHSNHVISYNFDWKIFMEIFLDLYHVRSFHPGLSSLADCNTFDWVFGENWSCQTAKFNRIVPADLHYFRLYELYNRSGHMNTAKYGAVWLGIYPNIMIEYYPGTLVVSTIWPNGPGKCLNYLEFYYENELLNKIPEFAKVQQESFMATADEDEIIGNRIQEGLNLTTRPFSPKNHPTEEAGYQHFHQWIENFKL